ncbi:hypothetical protein B0H63DRAFT_64239 [Podospora didyma]|uniref:Uncharacterized protein n=1 Tax=Podospora didyma TaxID=330526 RepID=A0AAE0P835_9PEZI|nr:hypothetical protein B0H63DRAFT_64239 [Podospora didyma]
MYHSRLHTIRVELAPLWQIKKYYISIVCLLASACPEHLHCQEPGVGVSVQTRKARLFSLSLFPQPSPSVASSPALPTRNSFTWVRVRSRSRTLALPRFKCFPCQVCMRDDTSMAWVRVGFCPHFLPASSIPCVCAIFGTSPNKRERAIDKLGLMDMSKIISRMQWTFGSAELSALSHSFPISY